MVHDSTYVLSSHRKKSTVYLHIKRVCSRFLDPHCWIIYSFRAVCLCSIGHSKQINNRTERSDSASLSPPSVLCCGAVCQERGCNTNSFSLYWTNCSSAVSVKVHKTLAFQGGKDGCWGIIASSSSFLKSLAQEN